MCGYDPFASYERQLDIEYDMWRRGIENIDDYYNTIQDEKECALIAQYEDR